MASFSFLSSAMALFLLDLDQVPDPVGHAAGLLGVLDVDRVADATEPQRAQRVELLLVGAVLALDLGDPRHQACASTSASWASAPPAPSSGASASCDDRPSSVSPAGASLLRPRTSAIDRPRICATSSGVRRSCRPASVALTRLIGF